MSHPYLPGTPAPSQHLVEAARILAEIEWRECMGFDIADLEAEFVRVMEWYTIEAVWGTFLPAEAFV